VVKGTKHLDAVRRFLKHPDSDAADQIFERLGFIVRPSASR